ncbi:MAG: hypothetical protein MUP22_13445 [Desulfobacterales bacterium]|nr:hypothetical protein [Desulfobacterales bacterium]
MHKLKKLVSRELHISLEQVQLFALPPSTYLALMYHTGLDPFTKQAFFVGKDVGNCERQKPIFHTQAGLGITQPIVKVTKGYKK